MLDCLPPGTLQVGQNELEPDAPPLAALPPTPQPGQNAELLELATPPRTAPILVAFTLPRAAPTPLLNVLKFPRWFCWVVGRAAPWLDRKLNDDEIAFILLPR